MAAKKKQSAAALAIAPTKAEREAKLKAILDNKDLDVGTLRGKFAKKVQVRGVLSTGGIGLDIALGVKGLPKGRIVEIFGQEQSGKTTLTLHMIAECQKAGGIAAFIDAEHALDVDYAARLGVNPEELIFKQPDNGEEALQTVEKLVKAGVNLIVVDSVAALTPKAEIDGEIGDQLPGLQARLMSQACRKLGGIISKTGSIVVFINQMRMKIMTGGFGSPNTTTGGKALRFWASIRIEVIRKGRLKIGETHIYGNRVLAKVVKNKVAPPFRQCEFDIVFGEGIDTIAEILDFGIAQSVIKKSGAWYSHAESEERMGQGRLKAKEWLRENPEVCEGIRQTALNILTVV